MVLVDFQKGSGDFFFSFFFRGGGIRVRFFWIGVKILKGKRYAERISPGGGGELLVFQAYFLPGGRQKKLRGHIFLKNKKKLGTFTHKFGV